MRNLILLLTLILGFSTAEARFCFTGKMLDRQRTKFEFITESGEVYYTRFLDIRSGHIECIDDPGGNISVRITPEHLFDNTCPFVAPVSREGMFHLLKVKDGKLGCRFYDSADKEIPSAPNSGIHSAMELVTSKDMSSGGGDLSGAKFIASYIHFRGCLRMTWQNSTREDLDLTTSEFFGFMPAQSVEPSGWMSEEEICVDPDFFSFKDKQTFIKVNVKQGDVGGLLFIDRDPDYFTKIYYTPANNFDVDFTCKEFGRCNAKVTKKK